MLFERRTHLVAHAGEEAALGAVRALRRLLRRLQQRVGTPVGVDLALQEHVLPLRLLLRHLPALVDDHEPPRRHRAQHEQDGERAQEHRVQVAPDPRVQLLLRVKEPQDRREHERHAGEHQHVLREPPQERGAGSGQEPTEQVGELLVRLRLGLAAVAAARVERAAERADGAAVRGAGRHVLGLEAVAAHGAAKHRVPLAEQHRFPRHEEAAAGERGDERRGDERDDERDPCGRGLCSGAEHACVGRHGQQRRDHERPESGRVDVVQVRAPELDVLRREAERLVHDQIRHQRPDPGHREVRVEREHSLQCLEHAHRHQQDGNEDVEHEPHDASRMGVREPREEVGPGE